MFYQSRKTARATMGAIGLLVLLFLLAACGSVSPTLAAASLQGASSHDAASQGEDTYFAGYLATTPGTYTTAQVDFTVPTLTQPVGGPQVAYAAAIGTKGGGIIDAGIYSYLDASGNQINNAYWEYYSDSSGLPQKGEISLQGGGEGAVRPGDQIQVNVGWGPIGDVFTIQDFTTFSSGSHTLGNAPMLDATTAGCIVLIPIGTSVPPADFGTVKMQGCEVASSDKPALSPIGSYQTVAHQIVRQVNGGAVNDTAFPSDLVGVVGSAGQDFSVTWANSQPQVQAVP